VARNADTALSPDRHALLDGALRLSVLSIVLSGALGGAAVVIGVATASLSLLGFGLDAAIDSAASIVLVWRFRAEAREPHRAERIERIAETAVGMVLLALAAYLAIGAFNAITTGTHPEASAFRTVLLILALICLPPLAWTKYRVARDLSSGALRADSVLTAIAAVLAAIGLASLALDQLLRLPWGDAAGALAISVMVAREGWSALRSSRAPEPLGVD
jgi:divalent metal cation (Fe/Co/Zn/Cd) transporter